MSAEISMKAISDAMNTYEQMRNNLKYLIDVCEDFHQELENEIDGHYDILPNYIGAAENFLRRINEVKAALSLPRRNCDVGTAEEQTERFKDLCRKYRRGPGPRANCKGCPIQHESPHVGCTFAWAQMPYKKEGEE